MARDEIRFYPCKWEEIHPLLEEYIINNNISVESYWEAHVLQSAHYKMLCGEDTAGYFSIYDRSMITSFNVFPRYANQAQELFARVKKYESVTHAMAATGDEFLMSHCMDNYARIEKQAYISEYTEKDIMPERQKAIEFRPADISADLEFIKSSKLFEPEEIEDLKNGSDHMYVYIARHNGETVGIGVVEYGRIIKSYACAGMYVCENFRRMGIAANILRQLKQKLQSEGFRAFSGCWYYNHNSKKSMESAGAYSKTRLIKFYF